MLSGSVAGLSSYAAGCWYQNHSVALQIEYDMQSSKPPAWYFSQSHGQENEEKDEVNPSIQLQQE